MSTGEVDGKTEEEVEELREEYQDTPMAEDYDIPFEVAYCLSEIGKQPEDYDGPQRWCTKRASKTDEAEGETGYAENHYHPSCRLHGKSCNGANNTQNLNDPEFSNMRHGMYAEDHRLKEDFSEEDQKLFDSIMEWADAYGWPNEDEDPARYDLLRQYALERVRAVRTYEYLHENGEIQMRSIYDDNGNLVDQVPEENTLSEQHRLQRKLLKDMMDDLGLTPKQQGKQDASEKQADAVETIADVAAGALSQDDKEFDPNEFKEDGDET